MKYTDVVIIGAGAAGLMCAIEAGKRNKDVIIFDHANKAGKKILMSGGGRCNFTNLDVQPDNYISNNPHFCKSALSRFNQWDFIALVNKHNIAYHEREHGQLFCDNSSKDILALLLNELNPQRVALKINTKVTAILPAKETGYIIRTNETSYQCHSLVIATGGLSIPKMGASGFGYNIAKQFSLETIKTTAALVPLTWQANDKKHFESLSGIAVNSIVNLDNISFRENILFTHRGLSGPAILQISSYWKPSESVVINLLPDLDLQLTIKEARENTPQIILKTLLVQLLPKRLVNVFIEKILLDKKLANLSDKHITGIAELLHCWKVKPNGTEGYRTAEVTLGGVDCNELSSKTMQSNNHPGLFFIGEVVDVTGWLGGYNFQWAWSSGWVAGQYV